MKSRKYSEQELMYMTLQNLLESKKERDRSGRKLSDKTPTIIIHIIKLWLYPNFPKYHNHWSGEVGDRLDEMSDIKKKFKSESFVRDHTYRRDGIKGISFFSEKYSSPEDLLNTSLKNALFTTSDINKYARDGYREKLETLSILLDEFFKQEGEYISKNGRFTDLRESQIKIYDLFKKYFHDDYEKIDKEFKKIQANKK